MSTKLTKACGCGVTCLDFGQQGGCRYVAVNEGPQTCVGDHKPCYVREGNDDGHWRCGTVQCGSDYLAGRAALQDGKPSS